jgi:hypothetical protein
MNRLTHWITALAILVGSAVSLSGCGQATASNPTRVEPATVEPIGDTGVKRLTLTDKAVERLAVTTAFVTKQPTESRAPGALGVGLLMPYAALLYLPDGSTFTYTNPAGHSYVREPVTVDSISGDQAVLTAGPPVGTAVVTTGGAELWGLEFGIK